MAPPDGERPAAAAAEDIAIPGATVAEITADDAEIARLAALPPLQYERERGGAAKKLGIERLAILDKLVAAERAKSAPADRPSGQGRRLALPEIAP